MADAAPTGEASLDAVLKTYSAVDFLIGLFLTLGASVVNALGLNIQKLDYNRSQALDKSRRSPDWQRPLWWLGLLLYIASQLVGSTLALQYLRAEYVAPLGATSLIFNVVFAYFIIGTAITRLDIIGTGVIIVGVIGVVAFGNLRGESVTDVESNLNLSTIKALWGRAGWIVYFLFLEMATIFLFWIAHIVNEILTEREDIEAEQGGDSVPALASASYWARTVRQKNLLRKWIKMRIESYTVSRPDVVLQKLSGFFWAVSGGLMASQTLVFAKSAVKLASTALSKTSTENQLASPLSIFIIILLAVAAVAQVYCLTKGLKVYEPTLIVPLFFAVYTAFGFLNSLIYLNQYDIYKTWVFAMIWTSILTLTGGVVMLSSKKVDAPAVPQPNLSADGENDEESQIGGTTTPGISMKQLNTTSERSRWKKGAVLLGEGRDREDEDDTWRKDVDESEDEVDGLSDTKDPFGDFQASPNR